MSLENIPDIPPLRAVKAKDKRYLQVFKSVYKNGRNRLQPGHTKTAGEIRDGGNTGEIIWREWFLDKYPELNKYTVFREINNIESTDNREKYTLRFRQKERLIPLSQALELKDSDTAAKILLRNIAGSLHLYESMIYAFRSEERAEKIFELLMFMTLSESADFSLFDELKDHFCLHKVKSAEECNSICDSITAEEYMRIFVRLKELRESFEPYAEKVKTQTESGNSAAERQCCALFIPSFSVSDFTDHYMTVLFTDPANSFPLFAGNASLHDLHSIRELFNDFTELYPGIKIRAFADASALNNREIFALLQMPYSFTLYIGNDSPLFRSIAGKNIDLIEEICNSNTDGNITKIRKYAVRTPASLKKRRQDTLKLFCSVTADPGKIRMPERKLRERLKSAAENESRGTADTSDQMLLKHFCDENREPVYEKIATRIALSYLHILAGNSDPDLKLNDAAEKDTAFNAVHLSRHILNGIGGVMLSLFASALRLQVDRLIRGTDTGDCVEMLKTLNEVRVIRDREESFCKGLTDLKAVFCRNLSIDLPKSSETKELSQRPKKIRKKTANTVKSNR